MKFRTPQTLVLILATLSLLVGSLGAVGSAAPDRFYVDPGGSDTGPGSSGQPWETLQHAVDNVGPGDRIYVRPGTYAGMRIETSGAPGASIRLLATAAGEAVINRPGPNNRHDSNVEVETWDGDGTVAYWIIEGLEVKNAPNWGIDVRGNSTNHSRHITIRDNNVHHNGVNSVKTGIFFAFTDHANVVGNHSHHNGEHGVYLSNSGDDFKVKDNRLRLNERCGLHMNGDLSQGGDGLISDGLVANNWIEGNGVEGCAGVNMDGVTDTMVSNNVIVENHASGITLFKQDGAQCSRRNEVVNNTVVQAADGRWAIVIGGAGCIDNTIHNNILLTRHSFRGSIEMPTANVPGLDSDYNVVADRFTVNDGSSVIGLTGWQTATGQDAHSVVAAIDDVFMAGRYRHVPGSAAEDAGTPGPSTTGRDGVDRPEGAGWDVGAYETPYCGGLLATHIGTPKKDKIVGTASEDVIVGLDRKDVLVGKAGDDVICGGDGADEIRGGRGNDEIRGQRKPDVLKGGKGGDILRGNKGDDYLRGNAGQDDVYGGPGIDNCRGETVVACE